MLRNLQLIGFLIFQAGVYVGRRMNTSEASEVTTSPTSPLESSPAPNTPEVDLTGKWTPTEMAKGTLSFQYGVCTHHTPSLGGGFVDREYPYSIKGSHLYLKNQYLGVHPTATIDCVFKITDEGHLEIRDVTGFAGKYKRIK